MKRGYDFSGLGIIRYKDKIVGKIENMSVHIYPETIFLSIEQTPATSSLIEPFLSPIVPELEVIIEVGHFNYVVKTGKVNKTTLSAKRGETVYFKQVEIVSLAIEMVPR